MESEDTNTGAEAVRGGEDTTAEIVRTGLEDGTRDAAEAAKKFYGQVSSGVGKAAYGLSYYSAFGAAFAVGLAKEVMPGKLREGFSDGMKAGGEAAENALTKVKETVAKRDAEESPEFVAGDDPLPGTA